MIAYAGTPNDLRNHFEKGPEEKIMGQTKVEALYVLYTALVEQSLAGRHEKSEPLLGAGNKK